MTFLSLVICYLVAYLFIQLSEDHKVLKLGDFGLARATEGTRQTKTLAGSYRYMAPEVIKTHGRYSKRADVYSFGELNTVLPVQVIRFFFFMSGRLNSCSKFAIINIYIFSKKGLNQN